MTKTMRVGIAGYGVVGQRRRQFIRITDGLEIVAVCDRKFDRDETFDDGVQHFTHYKRLLEEDLDVLFVCLSNDMAAEVTIAGLKAGLHVFCEKPPGRTVGEILRVIDCERQFPNQKLKYGFNHRYHDSVQDALALIKTDELGHLIDLRGVYGKSQIISFESDWRTQRAVAGGGILLDQGIHMVDLLRLFAGEFTEYHSVISNSYWNHDVEDNAYALMQTADGVVAMLHSSATQWRHRFHLEMSFDRGTIILAGILSGSKSYGSETLTVSRRGDHDYGNPQERMTTYNQDLSWQREISEFANAIIDGGDILNGSSQDALETMQTVYRIYCADSNWRDRYGLSVE